MSIIGSANRFIPSIRNSYGSALLLVFLLPAVASAELSESRRAQLTQVWQEEFAATELLNDPFRQPPGNPQVNPSLPTTSAETYSPMAHLRSDQPHPAVARIVVPEAGATSYGSGTLVDVREQFGLVITNWHVVRDATGPVEVHFPGGFQSKARALKVDADWDLAALVIWRPPLQPVELAATAPRPGDQLTICGYGAGAYRAATGRCTQYYAPRTDFPQEMVELNVEARQGDSGGPIFNTQGQLAGVLFGAGQGTTLGSFGGRVETFLATLAPDIGQATDNALVAAATAREPAKELETVSQPQVICRDGVCYPVESTTDESPPMEESQREEKWDTPSPQLAGMWGSIRSDPPSPNDEDTAAAETDHSTLQDANGWRAATPLRYTWFAQIKTAFAAVGLITVCMFMLKAVC